MAAPVMNQFTKFVVETEGKLIKREYAEVKESMHLGRVVCFAAGAGAAIIGLIFTRVALAASRVTFGLSLILLAPAAVACLVAYEAYQVVKCCNIIINRANDTGVVSGSVASAVDVANIAAGTLPAWAQQVRKEVDATIIVAVLLNMRA